jgi:hypothetical protein
VSCNDLPNLLDWGAHGQVAHVSREPGHEGCRPHQCALLLDLNKDSVCADLGTSQRGQTTGIVYVLSAVTGHRCILVAWAEKWHQSSPLANRRLIGL